MKSYEQMARSVLSRRDQILKRQQRKKLVFLKYAARVSTACGAMALCVGALAVWHNIKDTQKDLDEIVRPTEPTTQTTVALTESDSENDNTNNSTVIQDTAETTAPAVTTKVVVTSVSTNKEGKKVVVTTEVAVPVVHAEPQVTTKPVIGPSPTPPVKNTTKPVIGPTPKPTTKATTKHVSGPITRPTTTTKRPIITRQPIITQHTTTTTIHQTEPPHTTAAPIITTTAAQTAWEPPQTTIVHTTAWEEHTDWMPAQTTVCSTAQQAQEPTYDNSDHSYYNLYRTFYVDGRYFNDMERGSYEGETSGMYTYYTGNAQFYDQNGNIVYEDVTIYARPGEYQAIVFFKSQYRYQWYNMSFPY